VKLSGVNSINRARIVAQVVYYFTAAVALGAPHRKVAFTVPTGNSSHIADCRRITVSILSRSHTHKYDSVFLGVVIQSSRVWRIEGLVSI